MIWWARVLIATWINLAVGALVLALIEVNRRVAVQDDRLHNARPRCGG